MGILFQGRYISHNIPECSVNFKGDSGEVGDSVDGVSIGWLVCMGARLFVAPAAFLAFQRVAAQFH